MPKPILVSGIKPSGRLHIGNYLGALKNFVGLQNSNEYQCYFFIADLHSLTEPFNPKEKSGQILDLVADYLALGLDPERSVLFRQSHIPAHTELAWILGTLTPMGELRRMTQFKEKSEKEKENANAGLFTYPVLMAADILLYDTAVVPVGDDQLQHLELARTLARRFNAKFPARRSLGEGGPAHRLVRHSFRDGGSLGAGGGETFTDPQPLLTHAPRIMSLDNPKRKMSKSEPNGCIFLDDSPEDIRKKMKAAVTDSGKDIAFKPEEKPAISNLLTIYAALRGESIISAEKEYKGKSYAEFKSSIAEQIVAYFKEFRKKKQELLSKKAELKAVLDAGSKNARVVAEKKMAEVREKIGVAI